eukprot:9640744-Alexandrium_andersonii.AAC.1
MVAFLSMLLIHDAHGHRLVGPHLDCHGWPSDSRGRAACARPVDLQGPGGLGSERAGGPEARNVLWLASAELSKNAFADARA